MSTEGREMNEIDPEKRGYEQVDRSDVRLGGSYQAPTSAKNGSTLAIASLVCGVLSLILVFVWGPMGAVVALVGAICGIISIAKHYPSKGLAIVGVVFSCLGFIMGASMFGCAALLIGGDNAARVLLAS